MKVITVKQPFASLIAEGIKEYEFRTWKTSYRGEIYIHAGLGKNIKAMEKFKDLNLEYPQGCIIAKAQLVDCIKIDDNVRQILKKKDSITYSHVIEDKTWQGFGFKLENVEKIKPIYVKGKLGLWNL